jgi:hypothetical protein
MSWRNGRMDSRLAYATGSLFGVVIGFVDVYFPSNLHNLLYYFAVYFMIFAFAYYISTLTSTAAMPLRTLGIASLSMGFWAIAWSTYYFFFQRSEWIKIFLVDRTIGIGLGMYVPIGIYIFSTLLQSLGGAFLIYITTPNVYERLLPWVKSMLER